MISPINGKAIQDLGSEPSSDRYTRNTIATGVGQVVRLAIVLWLTPILITGLGLIGYGIWVLLFALVEYSVLMTFGIGAAFSRFIAEAHGEDNKEEISRTVSTGLLFYAALTALLLTIWYLGLPIWKRVLGAFVGTGFHPSFLVLLVAFLLRSLGTPYRALINGIQRMEFTNAIMVIFQITIAAGSVFVLHRGGGIWELSIVWAACSVLNLLLLIILGHRLYPPLEVSFKLSNRATFDRLKRFGIRVYAATLAETSNRTSDKLILGLFMGAAGPAAVAIYDIGQKLAGLLLMVPATVVPPIVPAIAVNPQPEKRRPIIEKGLRLVGALAVPGTIILVMHASDIVGVWTGISDTETGGAVASILILATLAFVVANLAAAVARGLGDPTAEMQFSTIKLALNLVLSIALVFLFGLIGVVVATLTASFIAYGGLLLVLLRKYRLFTLRHLTLVLLWPGLLTLGTAFIGSRLFPAAGQGWSHLIPALLLESGMAFLLLHATGYFKPFLRATLGRAV